MTRSLLAIGMGGFGLVVASACVADREEARPQARVGAVAHAPATARPVALEQESLSADTSSSEFHARAMALERRVRQAPQDIVAIMQLAGLFESAREWEQAARYYRRALTITRPNRNASIGIARVYVAQGNWDAAEEGVASLLAVSPDDPEAMYLLGAIHAKRGDYATARAWWRKVEQQASDPELAKQAAESLQRLAGSPS